MSRKLTPKAEVLKAHPKAYAWSWSNCWVIYTPEGAGGSNEEIGTGRTPAQAWKDAATRLASTQAET